MIVNFNKKYVIDIYKYNIYIHMCTYTWSIYTTLSNYTILVLHLTAIYSNAKGLATWTKQLLYIHCILHEVTLKSYCTQFLYCPAQLSWLELTALYRPLRLVPLISLCLYEPKWRVLFWHDNWVHLLHKKYITLNYFFDLFFKIYIFLCDKSK